MSEKKYYYQISPIVVIATRKPISEDHYEIEAKVEAFLKQIPKGYDGFEIQINDVELLSVEVGRDTADWREEIEKDENGKYKY